MAATKPPLALEPVVAGARVRADGAAVGHGCVCFCHCSLLLSIVSFTVSGTASRASRQRPLAVFYGGFSSNTIVALSGWFLGPRRVCTGSGYYYRTDRQEVIDWILETVPESEAAKIDIVEL